MTKSFPETAPELLGESVRLCQLDESVIEEYVYLISDAEVTRLTATTETFTREQLLDWLKSRSGAPERLDWAIHSPQTGEFLGEIVLNEFEAEAQSMNLRIALLSKHTSKGLGSQALKLVCDYGFAGLMLQKITLEVLATNSRAIRAYQKLGFERFSESIEDGHNFIQMSLPAR